MARAGNEPTGFRLGLRIETVPGNRHVMVQDSPFARIVATLRTCAQPLILRQRKPALLHVGAEQYVFRFRNFPETRIKRVRAFEDGERASPSGRNR